MKGERIISAYKTYFKDFIDTLNEAEARKVFYVIDMPIKKRILCRKEMT